MQSLPRSALAIARAQHGLLTIDDLFRSEVSSRTRANVLASGLLSKVHRDVFKVSSHEETFEQRCVAACLAAPHAALSGPTAGRLMGLRKVSTNDVHVISRRTVVLVGVVGHRTKLLSDHDVQHRGALRLLRPARLACDLAAFLDDDDLESVIEQMLDRRMAQISTLREVARTFVRSGRNGSARIARVLDGRPAWRRPVDSDLELRLMRALERLDVELVPQFPVVLDSGRRVHIDLAVPTIKFGIEVDHVSWHGGRLDTQRDKGRDRELMRVGWTVARVTDDDISRRLETTTRQLVDIANTLTRRSQRA
jgi:very-short-patch-repair endonuclease